MHFKQLIAENLQRDPVCFFNSEDALQEGYWAASCTYN